MNVQVASRRAAIFDRRRPIGEPIYFPRLAELAREPQAAVIPGVSDAGVPGWRLLQPPSGVAGLFFATGREKPEVRLIDAALRTVHMLALDQDAYSITIEVRRVPDQRDPVIDVFIDR